MRRRLALATVLLGALACGDEKLPTAPVPGVARSASPSEEVDAAAAQPSRRGVWITEAYIDGRSSLHVAGYGYGAWQWTHYDFAAPGRLNGAVLPTRFGHINWYPKWPDQPDSENRDCQCVSNEEPPLFSTWTGMTDYDPRKLRGRGDVTFTPSDEGFLDILFDDNAFPGAEWYTVRFDLRYPLQVQPWPNQSPYVVSLSRQKYVSLTLLSNGDGPLPRLIDFSLGNDRGLETGIALGPGGAPLVRFADLNGDTFDDVIVRFPVSGLIYHGDAPLGSTVLTVTALEDDWRVRFVRGSLPVTFVP